MAYIFDTIEIDQNELNRMSEDKIKNVSNNKLIVRLVELSGAIIVKNGFGCVKDREEINNIMKELKNRDLLTDEDIKLINS